MPYDERVDLQNRLKNSYVGILAAGNNPNITPFKIKQIIPVPDVDNALILHGYTWNAQQGWVPASITTNTDLDGLILHPQYGLINYFHTVIYAARRPLRSTQYGVFPSGMSANFANVSLYVFLAKYDKSFITPESHLEEGSFLHCLFNPNPSYYEYQSLIDGIESGQTLEGALNKDYCISIFPSHDDLMLFRKTYPVGIIPNKESIILADEVKDSPAWINEIRSLVGPTVEIKYGL